MNLTLESHRMDFIDFSKPAPAKPKSEIKEYEIWLGKYHLGQGYHPPSKPQLIAKEKGRNFEEACAIYAAKRHYECLVKYRDEDTYVGSQDFTYWYDWRTNSNSWTGKYYPSKKEAQKSFK